MTLPLAAPPDPAAPAEPVSGAAVAGATGRIVRGGAWHLAGQAVTLLCALVATPFVLRSLGPERYGVLALVHLLIGCLVFSDLGMLIASTRFAAEAHARGDDEAEASVIWAALVLGVVPSAVAAAGLALAARPLLDRVLQLPPHLHEDATLALRLAAVGIVARAANGVLNSPQLVRLRMRLHAVVTTAASVAQIVGIPIALALGGGLVGAGAVIAGAGVASVVPQAWIAWRLLPSLARTPRLDRRLLGRLARFGGALTVGALAAALVANGEKLVLTRVVSVEALGDYTVAFALANLLVVPAASLFQAMLPAFSGYQASGRWRELARTYEELLRAVLVLLPPLALALSFAARPFFTLWAGPRYGASSTPLFLVMLVGVVATVATYVPGSLLVALGRADFNARYHAIELVPYLVVALAMTRAWGALGAAAAWSLRLAVTLPVFLLAARRGLPDRPEPLGAAGRAYGFALLVLFVPPLVAVGLGLAWPWRLTAAAASLAGYAALVYASPAASRERAWVGSLLRRGRAATPGP